MSKSYRITWENGLVTVYDSKQISKVEEFEVDRKVKPEDRVDFTKPIELFYPEEAYDPSPDATYPCEYVGAMHEMSNNFMSWFVVRDLTPMAYTEEEPAWTSECNLMLVRGDGKTDVPGCVVRNVEPQADKNSEYDPNTFYALHWNLKTGWTASIVK